jgi:cytochrome P450
MEVQVSPQSVKTEVAVSAPQSNWLLGNLREFSSDPLSMLTKTAALGRVTRLRFLNSIAYLLSDPEDIKYVLVDNHRNYHKGYGLQALKPVLGEGLLTSEDELHSRQRRLIQPAFHRQRIESYASVMTDATAAQIDAWQHGDHLDLHDELMHLTMTIVAKCLFDADVSGSADEIGGAISELVQAYDYNRIGPIGQFIDRFDVPKKRHRRRNLDVIDSMLLELIRSRRSETVDRGDLLSMILQAVDSESGEGHGLGMSDAQARDELITLFIAGHETTAIALSWTFYLLSRNPEVEARLLQELDDVLGNPTLARLPGMNDLEQLPYTRKVFSEAMRIYPPAYATARIALADDVVGGVRIHKGESVVVSQWVTHRDPRYWIDPEKFDPERFSPQVEAGRPKNAYFPFGLGPRRCVGEPFAWMEGHLVLATIAHRYRLHVDADHVAVPEPRVTLRPGGGVPVTVEKRQ